MAKTAIIIAAPKSEDGLSIPIPDGFTPPDGTEDGGSFQVMADLRMEDGKLILEKLDGKDVKDSGNEPEDESEDEPKPTIMGSWKDMMKGKK